MRYMILLCVDYWWVFGMLGAVLGGMKFLLNLGQPG